MKNTTLAILVPCFNEAAALPKTNKVLLELLNQLIDNRLVNDNSYIVYIDDGSRDDTWKLITQLSDDIHVKGIKLSRNFGHQNALLAGLNESQAADCTVTIDADLQDDVSVISEFIKEYDLGFDIVYGVRNNRDNDSWFKKRTAEFFYKLMKKLGAEIVPNHADFRLLSKRALASLLEYHEDNLFFRGLVPLLGFKTTKVFYKRERRVAGESKYPFKKMVSFALNGITSFSTFPLTLVFYLGIISIIVASVLFIYTIVQKLLGNVVAGWSSLMVSLWFLGGLQLFGISIVGEYVGKIFKETKKRPKYFIDKKI